MCYPDPPDPVQVSCPDCGEEGNLKHIEGPQFLCLECDETFSDGSDSDGSEFHNE